MSKEMKMADVWGDGKVPQDYTKFNGFKHDNGDWNAACYGLLFCTEEAAEAQSYALRNHDHLVEENAALREMLSSAGKELQSVIEHLNQYERKDFRCDQLNPPELTDMQTVSEIQGLLSKGEGYV